MLFLSIFFILCTNINSAFCMEKLQLNNVDEFFLKHAKTLKNLEGMNAYCNALDYIVKNLNTLEQSYYFLNMINDFAQKNISNPQIIHFSSIIRLDPKGIETCFAPISEDEGKLLSDELLVSFGLPIKRALYVPCNNDPLLSIKLASLYKIFLDNNITSKNYKSSFSDKESKELITWGVANYPVMAANLIIASCLNYISTMSSIYFPYACKHECYKNHIYHLENVAEQLSCIFLNEKELFSPRKIESFYNKYTLNMLKDFLKLIPFYREMCDIWKNDFMFLLQDIYKNNHIDRANLQQYLDKCQHLILVIQDSKNLTTLATLKIYYEHYYKVLPAGIQLNNKNKNRSPWIFGPLNKINQNVLSISNEIFESHLFFDLTSIQLPLIASSKHITNNEQIIIAPADSVKESLDEFYADKNDKTEKNKKNIKKNNKLGKKKDTKKNVYNKQNPKASKNTEKKQDIIISSDSDTNILTPTIQKEYDPQDRLKSVIMHHHLAYLTSYLNRCKELYNDCYHNYPFALDACVKEFGIPKKDVQDKSATCYFWPIFIQSTDKAFSANQIYLIIQDKNGVIFHRGPLSFDNPNLYLRFRKDKNCFNTIIDNALQNAHKIKEVDYEADVLSRSDFENVNKVEFSEGNKTVILNPFNGYFSSVIKVFSGYVIISDFCNHQEIYFPLTI
jgi:hypothetical protein